MYDLIFLLSLIAIGYIAGTIAEKRHYKSIHEREAEYLTLPAVTTREIPIKQEDIERAELVYGSVVISIDYFKRILAGLRNVFGGTVTSYESLVDRARREAILRMKEMASGSNLVINVRIETSSIGKSSNKKSIGSLEAYAYGTALYSKK